MHDDPFFHRLGRTAALLCALMAAVALAVSGVRAALGVLGGGVLVGVSFFALASGTGALAAVVSGQAGADRARLVRAATIRLVGRYALLGFLAYVMIARLRLPPLGLLAGASSVVAAAAVEAVRLRQKESSVTVLNGNRTSAVDRGRGQRAARPARRRCRSRRSGIISRVIIIPNYLVMILLIVAGLTVLGLIMRSRLSVENPGQVPDRARGRRSGAAGAARGVDRTDRAASSCRSSATLGAVHPARQLPGAGARV